MWLLHESPTVRNALLAIFIGLWLYWLWTRRNLYRFAFGFPGSFGIPFLGVAFKYRQRKDIIRLMSLEFSKGKSNSVCIWLGIYPVLLTADPTMVESIVSSTEFLDKAKTMYQPIYSALKGGVIASPVKDWHHNRKVINPSFSHKVLISFMPIFNKAKNQMIMKLDSLVGTGEHKLYSLFQQSTLAVTLETTMGKTIKENDEVDINLGKSFSFVMAAVVNEIILKFIQLQWLFVFYYRFHKTKNYLHNMVYEVIINRLHGKNEHEEDSDDPTISSLQKPEPEENHDSMSIKKKPHIFIDQAIKFYEKGQLTLDDIVAESNTIIAAAFETAANAMFSTIVMLAMHQDIQQKCYEEVLCVCAGKDFQMEFEDMQHLPYLEMVINETLRLLPSVPLIGRHVVNETQLTKDVRLPKDLQILISIFHLHRRTDIWGPDAEKFNPDHFLPSNMAGKHSHAFMPFSKGPRSCLGWRYALFVMNVFLSGLIRNFKFTTTFKFEDLEFVEHIGLEYLVQPEIRIHRR